MTAQEKKPEQPIVSSWVRVASLDEIPASGMKGYDVSGRELVLFNIDGKIYCTSNICTHAYALLSGGFLDGCEIECPLHAGRFNVQTGKALCQPVTEDLTIFMTKILGGDVLVFLPTDLPNKN